MIASCWTLSTPDSPEEKQEAASFPKVQGFGLKKNQQLEDPYEQKYSELPPPRNKELIKKGKKERGYQASHSAFQY